MGREIKILPLPVLWRHGRMEEKNRPWYPGECQLQTQIHPTLLPDAALQLIKYGVPFGVQCVCEGDDRTRKVNSDRSNDTVTASSWPADRRTKRQIFLQTARIIRPRPDDSNDNKKTSENLIVTVHDGTRKVVSLVRRAGLQKET